MNDTAQADWMSVKVRQATYRKIRILAALDNVGIGEVVEAMVDRALMSAREDYDYIAARYIEESDVIGLAQYLEGLRQGLPRTQEQQDATPTQSRH